ncbi:hypothetical protein ATANTOWER_024907 [Ataeniobius toweri]|uniref:Uncharacterized protein n=1 Tax=Ataeniobius toweri TaxID=208326 RepID=A0ABU7C3J5_9TELE|nr:hypothetical protein [Ataeniobius toweri]
MSCEPARRGGKSLDLIVRLKRRDGCREEKLGRIAISVWVEFSFSSNCGLETPEALTAVCSNIKLETVLFSHENKVTFRHHSTRPPCSSKQPSVSLLPAG